MTSPNPEDQDPNQLFNTFAVISQSVGILSLIAILCVAFHWIPSKLEWATAIIGIVAGMAALVSGVLGIILSKKNGKKRTNRAIAGVVLGTISLIIFMILLFIATP
jgi:hypothetical protein